MPNEGEPISDKMAESIRASLSEKNFTSCSPEEAVYILRAKWNGVKVGNPIFARDYEWTVTFSDEFEKQTAHLDKKIQGRILEAIMEISKDPMSAKGDTKKPLGNEWAGFWDHRTGDYRLVYFPDYKNKTVRLVTFGPRGSVYKSK